MYIDNKTPNHHNMHAKKVWHVDKKMRRAFWRCFRFASNADGTINRNVEYARCSLCNEESQMPDANTQLSVCPNCGVKMVVANRFWYNPDEQLNYLMCNSDRYIVCDNEDELALVLTHAESIKKPILYPVLKGAMGSFSTHIDAHLCK